jgi:hypothetical protein
MHIKREAPNSNLSTAKKKRKRKLFGLVPVAHTYNPSYSGGRDQEDHSAKPAEINSS